MEILRFNSTYIDVTRVMSSISSYAGPLRVISCGGVVLSAFDSLADGSYGAVYINPSGVLYQYAALVSDLNTVTPQIDGTGLSAYQSLVYSFTGSSSAGGLIDSFSTVALFVDYTNTRCAADLVTPLASELTYEESWDVQPNVYLIEGGGSGGERIAQLSGGYTYIYTGHIEVNEVNGAGTVTIRQNDIDGGIVKIASLDSNGNFTITFNAPAGQSTDNTYYVYIDLSNFDGNYAFYLQVLTTSSGTPPGVSPSPTTTPDGGWVPGSTPGGGIWDGEGILPGDGDISTGIGNFTNFMLLFLFIAAPAIGLGYKLGIPGMLGGGMFGLAAGVLVGLVPVWFIFITATGLVLSFLMWRGANGKQ
jgi:hypothetical protein